MSSYQTFATESLEIDPDAAAVMEPNWNDKLDALVRGELNEHEFIDEVSAYSAVVPDAAWNAVALLDQHYRRAIRELMDRYRPSGT